MMVIMIMVIIMVAYSHHGRILSANIMAGSVTECIANLNGKDFFKLDSFIYPNIQVDKRQNFVNLGPRPPPPPSLRTFS